MVEKRFTLEDMRRILRGATDLEDRAWETISESELREIAEEVGITPTALSLALTEFKGDLRATPPARSTAFRHWRFPAAVITFWGATTLLAPEAAADYRLPFAILFAIAGSTALAARHARRRRETTIIGVREIRYGTLHGERVLPWSSVVELKSGPPGTVQVVGLADSVVLVLNDFGDPEAVLAAVRLRIARASIEA